MGVPFVLRTSLQWWFIQGNHIAATETCLMARPRPPPLPGESFTNSIAGDHFIPSTLSLHNIMDTNWPVCSNNMSRNMSCTLDSAAIGGGKDDSVPTRFDPSKDLASTLGVGADNDVSHYIPMACDQNPTQNRCSLADMESSVIQCSGLAWAAVSSHAHGDKFKLSCHPIVILFSLQRSLQWWLEGTSVTAADTRLPHRPRPPPMPDEYFDLPHTNK
jgi:hypothetical protein